MYPRACRLAWRCRALSWLVTLSKRVGINSDHWFAGSSISATAEITCGAVPREMPALLKVLNA